MRAYRAFSGIGMIEGPGGEKIGAFVMVRQANDPSDNGRLPAAQGTGHDKGAGLFLLHPADNAIQLRYPSDEVTLPLTGLASASSIQQMRIYPIRRRRLVDGILQHKVGQPDLKHFQTLAGNVPLFVQSIHQIVAAQALVLGRPSLPKLGIVRALVEQLDQPLAELTVFGALEVQR